MSSSTGDSNLNCVIANGTSIEGDFKTSENVRIDGTIKGNIECEKKLVLGTGAKVEGTLMAQNAVIMGNVMGDVNIKGSLHLLSTAQINGDIVATKMIVDDGAKFSGKSDIG